MEFRSRSNTPQPARPAGQTARPSYEENIGNGNGKTQMNTPNSGNTKRLLVMIGIGIVILILLVTGLMFAKNKLVGVESAIKNDKFQAVFLTNGQVYFCKLAQVERGYVKCGNIYYLQVQQTVQPEQNQEEKKEQPQVSLTKLGNELHGPEDEMFISRDQVLFWENLKDDSKVVQAIKEHQNKK